MRGRLRELYHRYQSPLTAVMFLYSFMGVLTNVAGVLHVTGTVELELMAMVLEGKETPSLRSFAVTGGWWVFMTVGTAWAYLNAYEKPTKA